MKAFYVQARLVYGVDDGFDGMSFAIAWDARLTKLRFDTKISIMRADDG
jgi:hypothetical protein